LQVVVQVAVVMVLVVVLVDTEQVLLYRLLQHLMQ
jgi:hypothetical protein